MTTSDDAEAEPPRISTKQQRILTVTREWIQQRGYPPTVREIGAAVWLGSPSSAAHHIKALERHGLLCRDANAPRAVDICAAQAETEPDEADQPGVKVPVLGTIAAGAPILAEEHVEDLLTLPSTLVGHGTLFALNVKGDSMIEAAICEYGNEVTCGSARARLTRYRSCAGVSTTRVTTTALTDEFSARSQRGRGRVWL